MEVLSNNGEKDPELWRVARKRAGFKTSFFMYLAVNGFLWVLWWVTTGGETWNAGILGAWPIWPTLGWGIGIFFQYLDAYRDPKGGMVEREYEKLKKERGRM
jgi:hypothetical protein